jgi:hypothetical protein
MRGRAAAVAATIAVAGGLTAAAAAPAQAAGGPQLPAGLTIQVLVGSMHTSVVVLKHAPVSWRRPAAQALLFESKQLLSRVGTNTAPTATSVTPAAAVMTTAAVPGTLVGGLVLDDYCQSLGFDHSDVAGGLIVAPGAAFKWVCVAANGSTTPIVMQLACNWQYPGQVTVAYPGDVNDAYSWSCYTPIAGSYTDPTTGTTVDTVTITGPDGVVTGSATYLSGDGSSLLTAQNSSGSGAVVVGADGSGYIGFEGADGGTAGVVSFDGAGGTSAG